MEQSSATLSSYFYLFITDLIALPQRPYPIYALKEPGFARAYFDAYLHAFQTPKDGQISHQLIKKIHEIATQHLPRGDNQPGHYRHAKGSFGLKVGFTNQYHDDYNASLQGFDELLEKWFLTHEEPTHSLGFQGSNIDSSHYTYVLRYINSNLYWTCINTMRDELFDSKKHIPIMHRLLHREDYQTFLFVMREREHVSQHIEQQMQDWMDSYHTAMASTHTDLEKQAVIADTIQRLNQIHPFGDGNIRTCYILLNKLLSDHHLSRCILVNPNRLDGCSQNEIMQMIQEGQALYQDLLNHSHASLPWTAHLTSSRFYQFIDNDNIKELPPLLKSITCEPVNLSNNDVSSVNFSRIVLGLEPTERQTKALDTQGLFGHRNRAIEEKIHLELTPYFNQNDPQLKHIEQAATQDNYEQLLRYACAYRKFDVARIVMSYQDLLQIDINKASANGKTALDWLNSSTNDDKNQSERDALVSLLTQAGALSGMQQATPLL